MRTRPTELEGLTFIEFDVHEDERGGFERFWSAGDFAAAGLAFRPDSLCRSTNRLAGTLRGLHWQGDGGDEAKLVRVARGAIFDVAVDLRPSSPTQGHWFGATLCSRANSGLAIPPGFAHGFLTLADDTDVLYAIQSPYAAEAARGARWNDPAFAIRWPREPVVIAERDRLWPDWVRAG